MEKKTVVLDGQTVVELRRRKGWSQLDLARATGLNPRTIPNVEKGKPCLLHTARVIAKAFDVPPRRLWPASSAANSNFDPDRSEDAERVVARMDISIWNREDGPADGLLLTAPGTLPVRTGDRARIEAAFSRAVYPYVLWIDAKGKVAPVYPWVRRNWDGRPSDETRTEQIVLPDDSPDGEATGLPICEPAGMETVLLLLHDGEEPSKFDFREGFPKFPRQRGLNHPAGWIYFEYPPARPGRVRGIREDLEKIDSPVIQIQTKLRRQLGPHFTKILAISFPNQG